MLKSQKPKCNLPSHVTSGCDRQRQFGRQYHVKTSILVHQSFVLNHFHLGQNTTVSTQTSFSLNSILITLKFSGNNIVATHLMTGCLVGPQNIVNRIQTDDFRLKIHLILTFKRVTVAVLLVDDQTFEIPCCSLVIGE